ncbi:MAG: hypothetical protein AAFP22_00135 [Planctomycetota bacterium]
MATRRPLRGENGLTPGRGMLVLSLFALFMLGVTEAVQRVDPECLLGESGPIELAQLVLLAFTACVLRSAGRLEGTGSILGIFALLVTVAFVRELDGPLDRVWHGFWKVPAAVVLGAAAVAALRGGACVGKSIQRLAGKPESGLMLAAAAVILVQSRLLGRQSSWRGALEEGFVSHVPRLVEETSELGGYGLLAFAAVEARRGLVTRYGTD